MHLSFREGRYKNILWWVLSVKWNLFISHKGWKSARLIIKIEFLLFYFDWHYKNIRVRMLKFVYQAQLRSAFFIFIIDVLHLLTSSFFILSFHFVLKGSIPKSKLLIMHFMHVSALFQCLLVFLFNYCFFAFKFY